MKESANINPEVLKWARETAKMSLETAALKVSKKAGQLKEWEEGISQPTIRQAQTLAKAYKRPFALLFLPDIPNDFQPLKDFRSKGSIELGTASVFIIREIQQKQSWIKDYLEENNSEKLSFIGKYSLKDDPRDVAIDILQTLDINPLDYTNNLPILEWIEKSESNGIFISRTSFIHSHLLLNSSEIQGFAIADPYAPFVFINSDDWNAPQLFTLVHELAHLWIAETGISNNIESEIKNDKFHPVELFCNKVAANALMPYEYISSLNSNIFKNLDNIFEISKKLGVSSFSFIIRSLHLNIITQNEYKILKHEAEIKFKEFLRREKEKKLKQKEKPGGPNYYTLKLNRNSKLFTYTVLDAYHGGEIQPTIASKLLDVKVNKFSELESRLYR